MQAYFKQIMCFSVLTLYWPFRRPHTDRHRYVNKISDLNSSLWIVEALCQGYSWQAENRLEISPYLALGKMCLFQPQCTHPYTAAMVTRYLHVTNITLFGVGLCLQNKTKPNAAFSMIHLTIISVKGVFFFWLHNVRIILWKFSCSNAVFSFQ